MIFRKWGGGAESLSKLPKEYIALTMTVVIENRSLFSCVNDTSDLLKVNDR